MRLHKEVKGFQDLMIRTLMYAPPIDVNDITKALATWKVEDKTEFFRAKLRSMTINDFGQDPDDPRSVQFVPFHLRSHLCTAGQAHLVRLGLLPQGERPDNDYGYKN